MVLEGKVSSNLVYIFVYEYFTILFRDFLILSLQNQRNYKAMSSANDSEFLI